MGMVLWIALIWSCVFLEWKVRSYRVFLIGDSVDRYLVRDWCYLHRPSPHVKKDWQCPDCIRWYEHTSNLQWSSNICIKEADSIANLFLLGSKDGPPYNHDAGWEEASHTKHLLPNGTISYFEQFGAPDLIIFQIGLWDISYTLQFFDTLFPSGVDKPEDIRKPHSHVWNATLAAYEQNMRKRIRELLATVQNCTQSLRIQQPVNVGLRSIPYGEKFGPIVHEMNILLRHWANEFQLSFFDYNKELWSIFNYQYHISSNDIMRDGFHPRSEFIIAAAEKLLGTRYTTNLHLRGAFTPRLSPLCFVNHVNNNSNVVTNTKNYHCTAITRNVPQFMRVKAIATTFIGKDETKASFINNNLYFDTHLSSQEFQMYLYYYDETVASDRQIYRIGPLSNDVRLYLRLSPYEIMFLPPIDVNEFPVHVAYSHWFTTLLTRDILVCNVTTDSHRDALSDGKEHFIVIYGNENRFYHQFLSPIAGFFQFFSYYNVTAQDIIQDVSMSFLRDIGFTEGPWIPKIYFNGALLRLRTERTVYVVLNHTRHSIPNMDVFAQYGQDWSDVVVVNDPAHVERIPLGEPLR